MTITYDVPFEVNKLQFNFLMSKFSGIVAGQEKEGKFFIKVWAMKYADMIIEFLTINK